MYIILLKFNMTIFITEFNSYKDYLNGIVIIINLILLSLHNINFVHVQTFIYIILYNIIIGINFIFIFHKMSNFIQFNTAT